MLTIRFYGIHDEKFLTDLVILNKSVMVEKLLCGINFYFLFFIFFPFFSLYDEKKHCIALYIEK